jgi:hypothetical protein
MTYEKTSRQNAYEFWKVALSKMLNRFCIARSYFSGFLSITKFETFWSSGNQRPLRVASLI